MLKYCIRTMPQANLVGAGAWLICVCAYLVFKGMNYESMSYFGEAAFPLGGIILFSVIGIIEDHYNLVDVIFPRIKSYAFVFLIRLSFLFFLCALLIIAPFAAIGYAKLGLGLWISAVFYGCLGMTVSILFKSASAGYLSAFAVFFMELFSGGKFSGKFYTLSMTVGDFSPKPRVFMLVCFLVLIDFIILRTRSC